MRKVLEDLSILPGCVSLPIRINALATNWILKMISYQELVSGLYQGYLQKLAQKTKMALEDVEQEARLLCWSVVVGKTSFDATRGSAIAYVICYLDKWADGQACQAYLVDDSKEREVVDYLIDSAEAEGANPLDALMTKELEAKKSAVAVAMRRKLSLEETLWLKGMSYRDIAQVSGAGKSQVHSRIATKFKG